MKKKLMNLLDTLSRDEMRTVMGGYDDGGGGGGGNRCNNCCQSAVQACRDNCGDGQCSEFACLVNQFSACRRVLGCDCSTIFS